MTTPPAGGALPRPPGTAAVNTMPRNDFWQLVLGLAPDGEQTRSGRSCETAEQPGQVLIGRDQQQILLPVGSEHRSPRRAADQQPAKREREEQGGLDGEAGQRFDMDDFSEEAVGGEAEAERQADP